MVAPPQLSLFAFHLSWPGSTLAAENEATQALLTRVRDRGRVFLTGCWVDGQFLARVCVLCFRTRRDRIEECVQQVAEEVDGLQIALPPRSPVLIRTQSSRGMTKILPSPTCPVRAPRMMASTAFST